MSNSGTTRYFNADGWRKLSNMPQMLRRSLGPLTVALPAVLLLSGLTGLILFGVVGLYRGQLPWQLDLATLYGSGWKLRHAIIPYGVPSTPAVVAADGIEVWLYAYPPNFAPLAMGLSSLGWSGAKILALLLNLAAAMGLAVVTAVMMRPGWTTSGPVFTSQQIVVAGIVLGSPFVSHVVWLGNTTLLVTLALLLAWIANDRGRPIVAGLLLSFVAVKPQFALLPGLWLLLERRWVVIGSAAAGSLVLSAYAMIVYGPVRAFTDWFDGLQTYLAGGENAVGCLYCFGMGDVLFAGNLPSANVEIAGLLSMAFLWRLRERLSRLEILAVLMGLTAFFLPVHNYDLVILAPLAGAIAVWSARSTARSAVALAAAVLFLIPLRVVLMANSALLVRWREVILVGLMSLLVASVLRRGPAPARLSGLFRGSN